MEETPMEIINVYEAMSPSTQKSKRQLGFLLLLRGRRKRKFIRKCRHVMAYMGRGLYKMPRKRMIYLVYQKYWLKIRDRAVHWKIHYTTALYERSARKRCKLNIMDKELTMTDALKGKAFICFSTRFPHRGTMSSAPCIKKFGQTFMIELIQGKFRFSGAVSGFHPGSGLKSIQKLDYLATFHLEAMGVLVAVKKPIRPRKPFTRLAGAMNRYF